MPSIAIKATEHLPTTPAASSQKIADTSQPLATESLVRDSSQVETQSEVPTTSKTPAGRTAPSQFQECQFEKTSRGCDLEEAGDDQFNSYQVFTSKLVKMPGIRLQAVRFSQSGSHGKLLITFDQHGNIRFHKISGIKNLQKFDFAVAAQ